MYKLDIVNIILVLLIIGLIILIVEPQIDITKENFEGTSINDIFIMEANNSTNSNSDISNIPNTSPTPKINRPVLTSYDDAQINKYLVNVINSLNLRPEVPDTTQQKQIFLNAIIKNLGLSQTLAQLDVMNVANLKNIIDPVMTEKLNKEKEILTNQGKDFLAQLEQTNQKDISNMFATEIDDNSTFMQYIHTNIDKITDLQKGIHDSKNKQYQARIKSVQDKISGFRSLLDNESHVINTIKQIISVQNGLKLTVLPVSNNRYIIRVNEKCLSTNEVNRYSLETCKHNEIKQHFYIIPIYTKTEYQKYIKTPQVTNVSYPFYLITSVTNDNCLTNTNGNLTIEPCSDDIRQRWKISNDLIVCDKK